ncbi:beta strand repeat-containing protein, partial [Campylobacter jejuni]|uniref:beta strand repeat-containing protein n=1 Tax=Campylobacter jejuni TaxID=197 RepID=UPI003CD04B84
MASCANAKLNSEIKTYDEANKNLKARSAASVYTPQARVNTTINTSETVQINISDSGPHTIIIEAGGTLGSIGNNDRIIYAHANGSNTLTLTNLTNKGTINGNVNVEHDNDFKGTITVNTFENTGQVNGQIYMGVWGGNSGTLNIDKFNNSGTIVASNGKGVFFEGKNTNVEIFTNDGTIIGAKGEVSSGVLLDGSKIKTLENKASIIGDSESGRFVAGVIVRNGSTLSNINNSGTIQANGKRDSFGISVENAKIETLINSGFISGEKSGIYGASNSRIDSILNTGTIFGKQYGIIVDYGSYGDITIKDGGKIIGNRGIMIGQWQTMGALKVEGENSEIKGTQYGLYIGTGSQSTTIDILEGAQISGGEAGIYLDHGFLNGTTTVDNSVIHGNKAGIYLARGSSLNGTLEVKNGGIISGGVLTKDGMTTGYGIVNADSAKITGSVLVNSGGKITGLLNTGNASLLGDIIVKGKDSEVIGGISNSGNGKIEGSIKLENGGKIDTIVNSGNASISGDITVGAESDLSSIVNSDNANLGGNIKNDGNLGSIENSGSISGGIENNNGDLNIKNDGDLGGSIVAGGNGNTSISNGSNGNINGGIAVGSGSKVDIDNQGSVGKDENGNTITVESGGSVGIKDWVVSTDKNTGKLDTVVVG